MIQSPQSHLPQILWGHRGWPVSGVLLVAWRERSSHAPS